jgi:hypothetical protein
MHVLLLTVMVTMISGLTSISLAQDFSATNWRYITTSEEGSDYYYSVKATYGDIREVWIKRDDVRGKEIVISLSRYRCDSGAEQLMRIVTYRNNEVISDSTYDESQPSRSAGADR